MFELVPESEVPMRMKGKAIFKLYNFVTYGMALKFTRNSLDTYNIAMVVSVHSPIELV